MSFEWFKGKEQAIAPGKPGLCVILVDTSGSMADHIAALDRALQTAITTFQNAKVFKFAHDVEEMTQYRNPNVIGGTKLHLALERAAQMMPSRTVVVSDGIPDDAVAAMHIAGRMTGAIDTLWTTKGWMSGERDARQFMETLARHNKGVMRKVDLHNEHAIYRSLEQSIMATPKVYNDFGIRDGHMSRDRNFRGGNINIQGPGRKSIKLEEHIDVYHERIFHHHRLEDRQDGDASPHDTNLTFESSQVNYQEGVHEEIVFAPKQGFVSWLIKGSQKQTALPQTREVNRGALQAVPMRQALPPPQRSAPALQPPARTLDEAIDCGRLDCQAGAQLQHNPYRPDDGRHRAWAEGWNREAQGRGGSRGQPLMIESKPAVPASGWFSTKKQRV